MVIVKADTNDGDYVHEITQFGERTAWIKEQCGYSAMELLQKISDATKACTEHYNWPNSEYRDSSPYEVYKGVLTEEEIDIFMEAFAPYGEYGIHTIVSIKIFTGEVEVL